MARYLMILAAAVLLAAPLAPGPARADAAEDIRGVIGAQVEAFRADDLAGAFAFASRPLQLLFGTPENFAMMVQRGYPMVWRPRSFAFLGLREEGGAWWQDVEFVDAAGAAHVLRYELRRGPDGWRIHSVVYLGPPAVGV